MSEDQKLMDEKTKDFPFEFEGQKSDSITRECGACDSDRIAQSDVLQTRRFSVGHFRFTNAAGILTAAAQTLRLFSKGVGESGSDAQVDGNLTDADTDAYSEGALVTGAGEHFRALALHLTFGAPFIRDATGAARESREWMDGYRAEMQRRLMDDVAASVEHGEGQQPYKLGVVAMYPSQSGAASSDTFSQIGSPLAGAVIPFRAVLKGGAKSTSARLRVVLAIPTGRSIILGVRGTAADADTVVPVRAELLGYVARGSAESAPDVLPSDRAAMRQVHARMDRMDQTLGDIADVLRQIKRGG